MLREMLEEFRDREENRCVVFFDRAMFFDAEYARVYRLVDIVSAEMAFRDEFLPESDSAVAVDAGTFEEPVFFDVIPAYFVGAFDAARGDCGAIVALDAVSCCEGVERRDTY